MSKTEEIQQHCCLSKHHMYSWCMWEGEKFYSFFPSLILQDSTLGILHTLCYRKEACCLGFFFFSVFGSICIWRSLQKKFFPGQCHSYSIECSLECNCSTKILYLCLRKMVVWDGGQLTWESLKTFKKERNWFS